MPLKLPPGTFTGTLFPSRMFRLLVFLFLGTTAGVASAPRAARPDELVLLNDSLHKTAGDLRRWAYTEHRVMRDDKGRVKSEDIVRHDPSKPYAEQWTPIKVKGREPTERDLSRARRRGEMADPSRPKRAQPERRALGEVIDVARSSVAAETETHLIFDIPLLKFGNERFPPEKFQVQARLRKEGGALENISVRLRESFRTKLVVNVKAGEASLEFATVDERYPPTVVSVTGGGSASILFVGVGMSVEVKRTELKHVKPFDERFEVQIGSLKAIDF